MTEDLIALVALTAMEIVLGIDNIVFISILSGRLPVEQQPKARRLGLLAALGTRILLLLSLSLIMSAKEPFFHWSDWGIPTEWMGEHAEEINAVSIKDLILLAGGLFLLWKSVREIHERMEGDDQWETSSTKVLSFGNVILQIALLDIVFSLDSVITAVAMARSIWVMVLAVIIAIGVMIVFAERISGFVHKYPTIKMLALSFLILIGVMLIAEAIGTEVNKGYIYFAMAFALGVEMLNLRASRTREKPVVVADD